MAAQYGLPDDHGGQTDDHGAASHVHIGVALILTQQAAGHSHHGVGQRQTDDLHQAGVHALGPAHHGVAAGGAEGAAQLGAEEQDQQGHQHRRPAQQHRQRGGDVHLGQQYVDAAGRQGLVRLAQDLQVHGPEHHLGQDARQNGRDTQQHVEQARHRAGQQAGQHGAQHGDPWAVAREQQHGTHRRAGAEGAVHGQVGNIQNFIGNVNADGHHAPDQALGQRAGDRIQ